jgi:4-hydroxy-4-methyl-2-oxoglutarate aldolase
MIDELVIDQSISEISKLPTACITDGMSRMGLHVGWLAGLVPQTDLKSGSYVGRVMTVLWAPKQNRVRRKLNLYEIIRQRDQETMLLVAGGKPECYLLGDNTATAAKVAGFEAILVDGCVRDSIGLREVGIGVFAMGIEGGHPEGIEVVDYNSPVIFRGEWINPGDVVAADNDGAVVFSADATREILYHAKVIAELEKVQRQTILQQDPLEDLYAVLQKKHDPDQEH